MSYARQSHIFCFAGKVKNMNLTLEQIASAATGAVYHTIEDGALHLHRFNREEEEYYKRTNESFYVKALSTAGIKLSFVTDADSLTLAVRVKEGSSRSYFSVDVCVDGIPVGNIDNFGCEELKGVYTDVKLSLGDFKASFDLSTDEDKYVDIYLPWSARCEILELTLEGATRFDPASRPKKLLAYGDSITQGYDAQRPYNRYATIVSDLLLADEYNKAIGGEIFAPELASCSDFADPDYITVAYGTNDWGKVTAEEFYDNAHNFYKTLSEKYPNSRIFAITPIWRADFTSKRPVGPFSLVGEIIAKAVADLTNVTVIDGFDFVPKDPDYFADRRLHPNDNGFIPYGEKLGTAILREIK